MTQPTLLINGLPVGRLGDAPQQSVSVTADGTKTYSQMFDALYALLDITKVTPYSILKINKEINQLIHFDSSELDYTMCCFNTSNGKVDNIYARIMTTGSKYYNQTADGTVSDFSSSIVSSGRTITIYY